jgi:hypothetical protein
MRTFIFALAVIVPSCEIDRARAADKLPAFDVVRNCKAEAAGSIAGDAGASCKREETEAKNELTKHWSQFDAPQKRFCIGESSTGGDQSYVELLTCLEMRTGQFSGSQKQ